MFEQADFICYDRWPGPPDLSGLSFQGLQIHSSAPGENLVTNYIRDAINRGVVVLPNNGRYAMEITERR